MEKYSFESIKKELLEYKKYKYIGVDVVQFSDKIGISIIFGDN